MGKGSFVVGGEDYEGNINRNIASFQVITRDKSLGGFDIAKRAGKSGKRRKSKR